MMDIFSRGIICLAFSGRAKHGAYKALCLVLFCFVLSSNGMHWDGNTTITAFGVQASGLNEAGQDGTTVEWDGKGRLVGNRVSFRRSAAQVFSVSMLCPYAVIQAFFTSTRLVQLL